MDISRAMVPGSRPYGWMGISLASRQLILGQVGDAGPEGGA